MKPVVVTDSLTKLALTCGFTTEELETDDRIMTYAQALVSANDEWKLRNRHQTDSLSVDDYYIFINNVKTDIMETMSHVYAYDIIKSANKNNISIMYTDNFNSVSLNWGPSYGMSVQCSDAQMIELRDKLIVKFPLVDNLSVERNDEEELRINYVNMIAPQHDRTSCSDTNLHNAAYGLDDYDGMGGCYRCTLLRTATYGKSDEEDNGYE